jgi:hypothetical protein
MLPDMIAVCCSLRIEGMGQDETADECVGAIEWLREIERSAAELVEVGDLLFARGKPMIRRCCPSISCTRA